MTREDKELLIRDLCARVPYSLKVKCEKYPFPVTILYAGNIDEVKFRETGGIECIYATKPYLFPLSGMTGEQEKEYDRVIELEIKAINDEIDHTQVTAFVVDFYNRHHLDWRGLIPKGLALDATGLGIY